MTLNYQAIQAAVNQEGNASGFARLMQAFKALGVTHYDYLVAEGVYRYYDVNSSIDLPMNGVPKPVTAVSDAAKIKAAVRGAQAGQFDFERFCELAGEAGVPMWETNLVNKTVTYFDGLHQPLLVEPIPGL
ncbi:DUF1398 family protein [Lacticaseibacillus brantae]|uniref:Phage envelope protein n=1 Tax=Lacticaseibacillus brantae DSM 23927 TaxID=1423727 RepID=A0A0R2B975_9LACO|nr:DUF1398 family protein [Lacticaseibacillus brantae]KRM72188.1 Phage envelope protein [Lacticaseibacillus brantae DSM 23927]